VTQVFVFNAGKNGMVIVLLVKLHQIKCLTNGQKKIPMLVIVQNVKPRLKRMKAAII
jgi:hypothetical protein